MPRLSFLHKSLAACALQLAALQGMALAEALAGPVTLDRDIKPLLQQYCTDCHNAEKNKGDVNLVEMMKTANLQEHREVWAKVIETMESGDMPPEKKPKPSEQQKTTMIHFLEGELSKLDCSKDANPGRVTLRRPNNEEYRNTVRDLLRVDYWPEDFPNDEVGYGFDNIADVLSLSPMLMEKYLAAAEQIAAKTIVTGPAKPQVRKYKGNQLQPVDPPNKDALRADDDGGFIFSASGEGLRNMEFPVKGEYVLRIKAYGDQAGNEPAKLSVRLDGKELQVLDVPNVRTKPGQFAVKIAIDKGAWRKLSFAFLNDFYDVTNADLKLRGDRNLYLDSFELELPAGEASLPVSHRALITKMPNKGEEKAVARELLRPLLARAYRRPVQEPEVERIAKFVDLAMAQGGDFLEGMQLAVQATLCSPQFLFRWELDPGQSVPGQIRELNDFEVASRLSYFLWSSMPDEQLLTLARKGELLKGDNLDKEIKRMLGDWRARALVNNFGGQWLQIRNIWEIIPDPKVFPKWSDDLRGLMKEETERFIEAVMKEDRNVSDLLEADFTFLNERLAAYYGIHGVKGKEFQRVQLTPDSPRGGVLTLGAVLLTTSTPTRTSPVIRGKWILEQILGTPPPPPPPDVPPLTEQSQVNQSASLRERFAAHSKNTECAGCHKRMDPLGFALENFDATGAWRDKDGKFPIDPSGKLNDGRQFKNAKELKSVLKGGSQFVTNLSEKLLTYALGRGLDYNDQCAVKAVVEKTQADNLKFSALISAIVHSEPFLKRKTAERLSKN